MLFNDCKQYDFTPRLDIDGTTLEVVQEAKIVGFISTEDMKTITN